MKNVLVLLAIVGALLTAVLTFSSSKRERVSVPPSVRSSGLPAVTIDALPPLNSSERMLVPQAEAADPAPSAGDGQARVDPASAHLLGRFLDTERLPLGGVAVRILEAPTSAVVISDSGGRFEVQYSGPWTSNVRHAARVTLEARLAGFAPCRRSVELSSAGRLLLGDWVLVAAGEVAGYVLDGAGAPLGGAEVGCLARALSVIDGPVGDALLGVGATVSSRPDGSFLLEGVPAGRRQLYARLSGWEPGTSEVLEVAAGAVVAGVELLLEPAESLDCIDGVVVDPDGAGVPNARVRYRNERMSGTSRTDGHGRFRVVGLAAGTYKLIAGDMRNLLTETTIDDVPRGTVGLVIMLLLADRMELVVTDKDGPVERFEVALMREDGSRLASSPMQERPGGRLDLALPSAVFHVDVRAPLRMPYTAGPFDPVHVSGQLECYLEPARGVRGRVLADGAPVAGARVSVHRALDAYTEENGTPTRSSSQAYSAISTASDGSFLLGIAITAEYYLRVEAENFAPNEIGPLLLGPTATRNEVVSLGQGGTVEVEVLSEKEGAAVGRGVRMHRGDGFPHLKRTDEHGMATFERLIPGPWRADVTEAGPSAAGLLISTGSAPPAELDPNVEAIEGARSHVRLWAEQESVAQLEGSLSFDGQPATDWLASLRPISGGSPLTTNTDSSGWFRLELVTIGQYELLLTPPATMNGTLQFLRSAIDFGPGLRSLPLDLETTAIEGTFTESISAASGSLFHVWKQEGVECWTSIAPDGEGKFAVSSVPAGQASIMSLDADQAVDHQAPLTLWKGQLSAGGPHVLALD